ncbi:MAG: hypothetical protein Q7R79_00030 [bacterium]|nr:hypothetical protein [bacterium]
MEYKRHPEISWRHWLASPVLHLMVIPLVILDVCTEVYHHICFPLYGIPLVKRSQYIIFDRHRLSYLNIFEKIWCSFCAYANGLLHYALVIAGETERYWCGIKHKNKKDVIPPPHHNVFLKYGDEKAYRAFANKKD